MQASRSEGRRQTAHGKAQRVITPEARRERMRAHRRRKKARYSSSADEDELEDLPDTTRWDPSPEETADLRDRLLRAGEARAGGPVGVDPA